jgi:hypothetical protein
VVKLAISVAVLLSGMAFVQAWIVQAATGSAAAHGLHVQASVAHLAMLGATTMISVYKPWGRIRRERTEPRPEVTPRA